MVASAIKMGHQVRLHVRPTAVLRRSRRVGLGLTLAGLLGGSLLAACGGSSPATPSPTPGTLPVTFVYLIDGPDAGVAHTTHVEVLDAARTHWSSIPPCRRRAPSTPARSRSSRATTRRSPGTRRLPHPSPVVSTKCGSPFTIDPGQALVVTITASRIGACLTDATEPGASESPAEDSPAPSPLVGPS